MGFGCGEWRWLNKGVGGWQISAQRLNCPLVMFIVKRLVPVMIQPAFSFQSWLIPQSCIISFDYLTDWLARSFWEKHNINNSVSVWQTVYLALTRTPLSGLTMGKNKLFCQYSSWYWVCVTLDATLKMRLPSSHLPRTTSNKWFTGLF